MQIYEKFTVLRRESIDESDAKSNQFVINACTPVL